MGALALAGWVVLALTLFWTCGERDDLAPLAAPAIDRGAIRARRAKLSEPAPVPPFWGSRIIEADPRAIVPYVNERSLYQFQWGYRKQGRSLEEFLDWAKQELRPQLRPRVC